MTKSVRRLRHNLTTALIGAAGRIIVLVINGFNTGTDSAWRQSNCERAGRNRFCSNAVHILPDKQLLHCGESSRLQCFCEMGSMWNEVRQADSLVLRVLKGILKLSLRFKPSIDLEPAVWKVQYVVVVSGLSHACSPVNMPDRTV